MLKNNQALLLDTHIWLWFSMGNSAIPKHMSEKINRTLQEGRVFISAISLWEVAMLEAKSRITLTLPCLEWIKKNLHEIRLGVLPLTPEIVVDSCQLPDGCHGDPADRIIIATARMEGLPLISKDQAIIKYSEKYCVEVLQ